MCFSLRLYFAVRTILWGDSMGWRDRFVGSFLGNAARWNPFPRLHALVTRLEPWGILLAVTVFALDYRDRIEERTVRAWQLVTTQAPGNSGKTAALEYLNREDGLFCLNGECLWVLKKQTSLRGIDLSPPEEGASGSFLGGVALSGANLTRANLREVVLSEADLRDAFMREVDLTGAFLPAANLSGAFLVDAKMHEAFLLEANLRSSGLQRADLSNADLTLADFSAADLSAADLLGAELDRTRGDAQTKLPAGYEVGADGFIRAIR